MECVDAPRETPDPLVIRRASPDDADAIWAIVRGVLAAGDTYAWPTAPTREQGLALMQPPAGHTFVAARAGRVVGTYYVKPNAMGPGDHVANCGYMVAPEARGQGVGEAMCRHSLDAARGLGFRAMQFNAVVSTNRGAIRAWQRCGFAIVGTVPGAFRHPAHGDVAIHVMHRTL